jgi:hypothetical protein
MHNVGMPVPRFSRVLAVPRAARSLGVLLSTALVLSACGGDVEEPEAEPSPSPTTSPSPSSTVAVPEGVELTEVGADLSFGDSATVIHEPNQRQGSVLTLTVNRARQGTTKDFSGFILDDYTRAATPYYVYVDVENVGEGDLGGGPVPVWGVDGDNTLLPPASFTTAFAKCPSEPLPKRFAPGDSFSTCLVYLAPDGGTMEAVSFRPNQEFDPIRWTGEVAEPKAEPKQRNRKKRNRNRG